MKNQIMPCALCGQMPHSYGRELREYVDGEWSESTRKEYWIQPFCHVACEIGNMYSKKYGVVGGPHYKTEEAAIKAWNKHMEELKKI